MLFCDGSYVPKKLQKAGHTFGGADFYYFRREIFAQVNLDFAQAFCCGVGTLGRPLRDFIQLVAFIGFWFEQIQTCWKAVDTQITFWLILCWKLLPITFVVSGFILFSDGSTCACATRVQAGYHKVFCSTAVRGGLNGQYFEQSGWRGPETREVDQVRRGL